MTEKFSLKDFLFNKEKVVKIANEIKDVHPDFNKAVFVKETLAKFPELELMERIEWMVTMFEKHLPSEYREATTILVAALPPECDATKSDDDFGDFIYSPYSYYVARHGCTKKDVAFSLRALKEMTTRFSVEGPIRAFINAFPKETVAALTKWAGDSHYHVRRLASEGTRPNLPWAKKISLTPNEVTHILDTLHADKTRFVTRSVANHLNDISKTDPKLVVSLLTKWAKQRKQTEKELDYITRHALRTLVKKGDRGALKLLGYTKPSVQIEKFTIHTPVVNVGESLSFSFTLKSQSTRTQKILIDYHLHFKKKTGHAPKTFKLCSKTLKAGEHLDITKNHPLRIMTTRKLYSGTHTIELQVNGEVVDEASFTLKT